MSSPQFSPSLTNGRLLVRNTIWNIGGQVFPLAVAALTIPPVVRGLGIPRFGILSLAWIGIGYFSFLDLGIGRALTKLVAEKLGQNDEQEIVPLVWTSLLLMVVLGASGGAVLLTLCPWLIYHGLKIPADLQAESLNSFYLLALSLPVITFTAGLRGVLEALQCFRVVNLIRVPMSVFSFAGPLLVLPFSRSLVWIITVLILGRVIGCLAHLLACFQVMPALRHSFALRGSLVKPVLIFGGWMTVSNVISPVLVYVDRFVLGTRISVNAVAFYTAPFDMVVRLMVIPGAVAGVLFPAFAWSLSHDPQEAEHLLTSSLKYIFLAMLPLSLILVVLAPEGLRLWLGPSFAQNSSSVLRWLAAGVLANSLAHVPFALVQSVGRPDLTAKLHLIELPLYVFAVWWLTAAKGIEGTAIAWTGRLVLDALLIAFVLERMSRRLSFLRKLAVTMLAGFLLLYLGALPMALPIKICFLGIVAIGSSVVTWFLVLTPEERVFLTCKKGGLMRAGD